MRRGAAGGRGAGARGTAAAVAALALVLGACSGAPRRREPPEPALRIWTPGVVHWDGGPRELSLAIENGTERTVRLEAPGPRRARVVLFLGPGPDRVCSHDGDASGPPGETIALGPGESRAVRVDLEAACGRLPPGHYRYEVGYEAPAVGKGPDLRLRPRYGHVLVDATRPGGDAGSLGSGRGW